MHEQLPFLSGLAAAELVGYLLYYSLVLWVKCLFFSLEPIEYAHTSRHHGQRFCFVGLDRVTREWNGILDRDFFFFFLTPAEHIHALPCLPHHVVRVTLLTIYFLFFYIFISHPTIPDVLAIYYCIS